MTFQGVVGLYYPKGIRIWTDQTRIVDLGFSADSANHIHNPTTHRQQSDHKVLTILRQSYHSPTKILAKDPQLAPLRSLLCCYAIIGAVIHFCMDFGWRPWRNVGLYCHRGIRIWIDQARIMNLGRCIDVVVYTLQQCKQKRLKLEQAVKPIHKAVSSLNVFFACKESPANRTRASCSTGTAFQAEGMIIQGASEKSVENPPQPESTLSSWHERFTSEMYVHELQELRHEMQSALKGPFFQGELRERAKKAEKKAKQLEQRRKLSNSSRCSQKFKAHSSS